MLDTVVRNGTAVFLFWGETTTLYKSINLFVQFNNIYIIHCSLDRIIEHLIYYFFTLYIVKLDSAKRTPFREKKIIITKRTNIKHFYTSLMENKTKNNGFKNNVIFFLI